MVTVHVAQGEGEAPACLTRPRRRQAEPRAARETVALPMYPELTDDQAQRVVAAVRAYFGS